MNDDFRQLSRQRWAASAGGWETHAGPFNRAAMPVTAWMVDALRAQPGHTLLELAAGTGDTGLLAAEMVRPGGEVILSDFVPEMLSAAQRRAAALGLDNVRFRQIDAELPFDIPAATLDGVLARWGYHLLADPGAALRETRRVLRPGARVALSAWTGPHENPWTALPQQVLADRGLVAPADPGAPGQFTWAPDGAVAEQLEAGGFVEHHVEPVAFTQRFASPEAWWEAQRARSMRTADAVARLDSAGRAGVMDALREVAAPYTQPDGSLVFPSRTWVAWAEA